MVIIGSAVEIHKQFTGNKFVNLPSNIDFLQIFEENFAVWAKFLRQQQMKRRWPYIISIEGGLAAGKSDFLRKCEDSYMNVMFCPEPQNLWRNVRCADASGTHENPYDEEAQV